MRRVLPWALLGIVGLAAAAGAALGAAAASAGPEVTPPQWVANVLTKTAQAGTAHLSYTHVTTSPNPELRSTLSGRGVVDFSQGSARVTEIDHSVQFEEGPTGPSRATPTVTADEDTVIGTDMYQRIYPIMPTAPFPSADFPFTKVTVARQPRTELGLSFALGAASGLGDLDGIEPVVAVRDLGPATVNGQATTEYLVRTAPPQLCPSVRRTAAATEGPSVIWVDGRGRLVQVRTASHFSGCLPAATRKLPVFAQFPIGPSTTTDPLTFSASGSRVHIAAPPRNALAPEHGSSRGYASFLVVGHTCTSK